MKKMMMVMTTSRVMAIIVTMMVTMMITMVIAMMITRRYGKGCCAGTLFPNKLAPTFKIVGPVSLFAFSRNTDFVARLHRLSSGLCFPALKKAHCSAH